MIKNFKIFEASVSKKNVIESINNFLVRALPDNFKIRHYQNTLNITDTNIKSKVLSGYYYVSKPHHYESITKEKLEINLCSRTLDGSNFNLVQAFIVDKMRYNNISIEVLHEEDNFAKYDVQDVIIFDVKYYDDVINFFNNVSTEEFEIFMNMLKYNL